MPKTMQDRKDALLERNAKALAAIDVKIAKADEGKAEKIDKAQAKVDRAKETLEKAQKSLNDLQLGSTDLQNERQRLADERTWIEAMPTGAVATASAGDEVFDEHYVEDPDENEDSDARDSQGTY
jgi:chromosome segregation ATPase